MIKNYKIKKKNANWNFKGKVYKNFDNHVSKSVPLYEETHNLYLKLSDFFLQNNSKIIDIGCSTGKFINNIYQKHNYNEKKISFVGIDNVQEMIGYCKKKYLKEKITFKKQDINKYKFKNCCIIASFYTIQFISPKERQKLINSIYNGLNWGGAFFFVEKVRGNDARFQDIMNQAYIDFKFEQGFSSEEILSKSRSLKSVLEPFSTQGNLDLLKRAVFKDILSVFKYLSFEGFLAIK